MGKGTIVGLLCGYAGIFISMIMEGGNPASLIAPAGLVLIVVGTFGAACGCMSLDAALGALKAIPKLFADPAVDAPALVARATQYAESARRDGILSLEGTAKDEPDPILQVGLRMLIDGGDAHETKNSLQAMALARKKVWDGHSDFFNKMGGFAPCLGIIGTVMGLIHTLHSLGGDPAELGELIGAAFIATLFGVMFANVMFLPWAAKFKAIGAAEVAQAQLAISAVDGMAAGLAPRVLKERLAAMLPPAQAEAVLADKGA
jgi:chemotaxis protein MotA